MRRIFLLIAALAVGACVASPAWALGVLPPEDPLLPSERLPEGLLLALNQENPRWQPQGILPAGMPEVFLEMARLEGGQAAPAKAQAPAKQLAASAAEVEPASALLSRSDLNASVPLPDPAFEFKSGSAPPPVTPPWLDTKTSHTPPEGRGTRNLPLAFSASGLGADPPSRPTAGRAAGQGAPDNAPWLQAGGPLFGADGRIQEEDGQGGFLALKWNPARALGVTVGGGLQRSQAAVGGESSAWQVANAPRPAMSLTDNNSGYANTGRYSRWAAYVAVPYQLNANLGLQPEVSYYYTDMPDLGAVAGNEWVMGLQFTFGF